MPVKAPYIKGTKVEIQEWIIHNEIDKYLNDVIMRTANEILQIAVEEYPATCYLNIEWPKEIPDNRGCPGDEPSPLTIMISIPLENGAGDGPTWAIAVDDLIEHLLDVHRTPSLGKVEIHPDTEFLLKVRDRFLKLAKDITDNIQIPA